MVFSISLNYLHILFKGFEHADNILNLYGACQKARDEFQSFKLVTRFPFWIICWKNSLRRFLQLVRVEKAFGWPLAIGWRNTKSQLCLSLPFSLFMSFAVIIFSGQLLLVSWKNMLWSNVQKEYLSKFVTHLNHMQSKLLLF